MATDRGQGLQAPWWHGAGQRWLPQRSRRPHGSSQGGQLPSQQRLRSWPGLDVMRSIQFDWPGPGPGGGGRSGAVSALLGAAQRGAAQHSAAQRSAAQRSAAPTACRGACHRRAGWCSAARTPPPCGTAPASVSCRSGRTCPPVSTGSSGCNHTQACPLHTHPSPLQHKQDQHCPLHAPHTKPLLPCN